MKILKNKKKLKKPYKSKKPQKKHFVKIARKHYLQAANRTKSVPHTTS